MRSKMSLEQKIAISSIYSYKTWKLPLTTMSENNKEINDSAAASGTVHENCTSQPDEEVGSNKEPATEKRLGLDFNTFPDGGWEAWLSVAGGFSTVFVSFGWINCERFSSAASPMLRLLTGN
jgi:hypothetical protein